MIRNRKLFDVVDAAGGMSFVPRRIQCRQQHSREDGDDGNNDKEFYQSKKFAVHNIPFLLAALSVVSDDLKYGFMLPCEQEIEKPSGAPG